jgi:hypothetical protein
MDRVTCKRCDTEKSPDEMIRRAGKVSNTCRACWSQMLSRKGGGTAKKQRSSAATDHPERAEAKPPPNPPGLLIPAGHGLHATLEEEDSVMRIVQGDDELVVTKFEFFCLVEAFPNWSRPAHTLEARGESDSTDPD